MSSTPPQQSPNRPPSSALPRTATSGSEESVTDPSKDQELVMKVAQRVYEMLLRDLQIERERLGHHR